MHLNFSNLVSISLLLSLLFLFPRSSADPIRSLSRGSYLTVERATEDFLISPGKTFAFGFTNLGGYGSNAYWLAIWFTRSKDPSHGLVWMANRDIPVNGRSSRITLSKDGALTLTDVDGSVTWQSNTTNSNVDRVELLETGNLVIKDPNGIILWQSFDFPTDTLLPSQLLTRSTKLISGFGEGRFGAGYFSLLFDNDNVLRLLYQGPDFSSLYWPDPDVTVFQAGRTSYNSSRIAILDASGAFLSSDRLQFRASDAGTPRTKRRLKLDNDGNLRLYSLNDSSGLWSVTWEALALPCKVHGLCGRNGVCVYRPEHRCSCPPGYELANTTDWSQGCKPKFTRSCNDSQFVELKNTDFYGFDLNYTASSLSLQDCMQLCLQDCRCQAFSYKLDGIGSCYTKSALFNGYSSPDFVASIYLRLPSNYSLTDRTSASSASMLLNSSDLVCNADQDGANVVVLNGSYSYSSGSRSSSQRSRWVYLYSFASALGLIEFLILAVGWFLFFGKHGIPASLEDGYKAISSQFRSFNYRELQRATNRFREVLGTGGFGSVYKGRLEDGRIVAVKRLGGIVVQQGEEEFWAEVSTIGRINHMNLVHMWGFCSEKKHRLLVYEFIEKGSLDKYLFSDYTGQLLSWKERYKVAVGTAKGLAYLHHECLEWIIHCDVKPENILLEADFEPKISDFGLAKLSQRGGQVGSDQITRIRGTKGYMAPEWVLNLPITAKVDVYSFGVVVLELVKGIRLSNWVEEEKGEHISDHGDGGTGEEKEKVESEIKRFVRLAKRRILEQEVDLSWVEDVVDSRLERNFNRKQVASVIKVGVACVEEDRNKRPSMESVLQLLLECEEF